MQRKLMIQMLFQWLKVSYICHPSFKHCLIFNSWKGQSFIDYHQRLTKLLHESLTLNKRLTTVHAWLVPALEYYPLSNCNRTFEVPGWNNARSWIVPTLAWFEEFCKVLLSKTMKNAHFISNLLTNLKLYPLLNSTLSWIIPAIKNGEKNSIRGY